MDQSKAFFIGYCSLPVTVKEKDRNKFLNNQIGNLFERYRTGVSDYFFNSGDYKGEKLFSPTYYYLWGKYDVCVTADIDDLEFATRFFRPFNPFPSSSTSAVKLENFDYKVITGINPIDSQNYRTKKLPYIAISQLKINSTFLVGTGYFLISKIKEHVIAAIKRIHEKNKERNPDLDVQYKIMESFSYHDLIIVFHSNSIYTIKEIIAEIRSLNVSMFDEKTYNSIIKHSIITNLISLPGGGKKLTNHLFESTHTTFGVHSDVHDFPFSDWAKEVKGSGKGEPFIREEIIFMSKWSVKSGHCQMVYDSIEKQAKNNNVTEIFATAGRGDITLLSRVEINPKSRKQLNPLRHPGNLLFSDKKLSSHVIETHTTIGFDYKKSELSINYKTHKDIHKCLKHFQIEQSVIEDAIAGMKILGVPKVLSEKVLKLISNYNNAVLNPDMYACFVELYFYITNNFLSIIKEYAKYNDNDQFRSSALIEKLAAACTCLEASFQNRFYQSYWMAEVLEINIDYSGGVQNLISAYDSCFKELNNAIASSNPNSSFVYVKSDHIVFAYPHSLLLNYLHLTQPYIYCAISIHETLNFFIEKWYSSSRYVKSTSQEGLIKILRLLKNADILFRGDYIPNAVSEAVNGEKSFFSNNGPFYELERSIENSTKYKLSKFVNERTLRYFITDYLNLKYAYPNNFQLFCKITWLHIIQLGNIYNRVNEMNPNAFITVSIRLILVQKYSNQKDPNIYPKELKEFLEPLIVKFADEVSFLIKKLTKSDGSFNNWFLSWVHIINNNEYNLMPIDISSKEIDNVKGAIDRYLLNYDNVPIDDVVSELNTLLDAEKDDLGLNAIYRHIIYNYLKFSSDNIKVLKRISRTGKPIFSKDDHETIIFIDPSGGTFVVGENNRKKYLTSRIKFIRLFIHLSSIQKKQYIYKIIRLIP